MTYLLIQATKSQGVYGWLMAGFPGKFRSVKAVTGPYDFIAEATDSSWGKINKLIHDIYGAVPEVTQILPCVGIDQ